MSAPMKEIMVASGRWRAPVWAFPTTVLEDGTELTVMTLVRPGFIVPDPEPRP